MEGSWFKFIKKYVWDDTKTPYWVAPGKLSKTQADYELFFYTLLLAIFFFVIALLSLSTNAPYGQSFGAAFYAFSVACSAIVFGMSKELYTAIYCSLAPLAVLLYFLIKGFPPYLQLIDKIVLVAFTLLWLRYSLRVIAIAKAYPQLIEKNGEP